MFLGTAIHDTAQVTGAALIYQQIYDLDKVIDIATVTKLTRNLFLILIIPLISFLFYKFSVNNMQKLETEKIELPKWYSFIPLFVIGFLLLVFLRTIGDFTLIHTEAAFGFLEKDAWEKFHKNTGNFGMTYILGIAMAGVGLSTNFKTLKGIG